MNRSEQEYQLTPIQIQPRYASRDQWEALAVKEGFTYEVLELFTPPAINDEEQFRKYKEWYLASDRVTSVHGSFINIDPGCGDAAMRELSRKRCRESCETAVLLGAKNIVFHSSCFPFLRDDYLDFWAGRCAEFYEELAGSFALHLFIENSPDVDPGPIKALMQRISNPRIGVCLDIGHINYSGKPLEHWFEELHEWVGYLHLSDNEGMYDSHLSLGQGTVDWEKADMLWKSFSRPMPVTLETRNERETALSVEFLKAHRFFEDLGGTYE